MASSDDVRSPGTLFLTGSGDQRLTLVPAVKDIACAEPNLVIVTHGWWEREPWPADMALAIAARTDPQQWRCGWYDWHRQAHCLRPWEAAIIGRDVTGPHLGQEILRLSRQWRHVHLIGHSAGSWVINAAAQRIADETHADIHITFLDAYVPRGWDEAILGSLAATSSRRCWVEQYFTRDFLFHINDTELTYAHNVDITKINAGFKSHKFPWIWYGATVTGQYKASGGFDDKTLWRQTGDVEYGFARSLETGSQHWAQSLSLQAGGKPVQIRPAVSSRATGSECHKREDLSPAISAVIEQYRSLVPSAMKKHKVPGCAVALVDERGILWSEGFGYADRGKRVSVTPDTPFLLCSISKTIAATAIMAAVQDGLLDIDAPVTKYLPDFRVNSRYESHAEQKITLRRLLTHTAGLPLDSPVGNIFDVTGSFEEHVTSVYGTWLICPVGGAFSYSNIGVDLAAYVLQQASGVPFEQYVKEHLLSPLGMSNTLLDGSEILVSRNRAVGHTTFARISPVIPAIAAGGIYASAEDLARFVQLHLNRGAFGGKRLLDEPLIDAMYVPQAQADTNVYRGLGFTVINRDDQGQYCLLHAGLGYGFATVMRVYPEYGIGEVILTNRMPNSALADLSIAHKLIRAGLVTRHFTAPAADCADCPRAWPGWPGRAGSPCEGRWNKYCGTYDLQFSGYEFEWWVKLVNALVHPGQYVPYIRVYRQGAFLQVTESPFFDKLGSMWSREKTQKLEEIVPGLFSTACGAILDFRGTTPTWRNFRVMKR